MRLLSLLLVVVSVVAPARAAADPLADALKTDLGHTITVGPRETMDGGYRGSIELVPQLPTGRYRKHLVWTDKALRTIDTFFASLFTDHPAPNYRWRDLTFHFIRSVGKRTPSAYARFGCAEPRSNAQRCADGSTGWTIAYNVNGSLLTSEAGVLETLWHELFHLNDFAHGNRQGSWSSQTLQTDYDAIVATCGTRSACLAPFAPNTTKVKKTGTYYAFQPNNGNGVHEYAAELAVRYFREHSQMLAAGKLNRPAFKCGPVENARAWKAIVDEFFGGRDLVPACATER